MSNIQLSWPASAALEREEFHLEIPENTYGTLRVYAIPKCEAYPEGYFIGLSTNNNNVVEPGCNSWEKTLLFEGTIMDNVASITEERTRSPYLAVEYSHPDIVHSIVNPEPIETNKE